MPPTMNAFRRGVLGLHSRSSLQSQKLQSLQKRFKTTTNTSEPQKEISPHIGFYKNFTRPVAKVLLMATFTYQLVYWGWVKLETDEIKNGKHAEVKALEEQLEHLTKKPVAKP